MHKLQPSPMDNKSLHSSVTNNNDVNDFLAVTLQSIGDGIISADFCGKVLFMNRAAEELTGWNQTEATGHFLDEIFVIQDALSGETSVSPFSTVIEQKAKFGLQKNSVLVALEGVKRYISASFAPILNTMNEVVGVVTVFRDITRIRKAEENLANEQKNLRTIFNNAPIGMFILDNNAVVLQVNNAALNMFGKTSQDIVEKRIGDAIQCTNSFVGQNGCGSSPDCKKCDIRKSIMHVFESQSPLLGHELLSTFVFNGQQKDTWLRINVVPILVNNELHVVVVMDDITVQRRIEATMKQAKDAAESANRAKSEFLSNMSHEIRTPLNGVMGMIDLALHSDLTKDQRENLNIAKNCSNTLINVINDVLDISKIEAGKMVIEKTEICLSTMLNKLLTPHTLKSREKGLPLTLTVENSLPQKLYGDITRLTQVLNNLLSNAIKFTDVGEINVNLNKVNESVDTLSINFSITDSGIGISQEEMTALFKSFSQVDGSVSRKYGGTGLGLAITKRLVELMDGTIDVVSTKGKGSTFSFQIPFDKTSSLKTLDEFEDSTNIIPSISLHILLAEDDPINQKVAREMLKMKGHTVDTANNGFEVLDLYLKKEYDLILMDIQMPELDGVETTTRIRAAERDTGKHIMISALTAFAFSNERDRYFLCGMDYFIPKPIIMKDLFALLDAVSVMKRLGDDLSSPTPSISTITSSEFTSDILPSEIIEDISESDYNIKFYIEKILTLLDSEDYTGIESFVEIIKEHPKSSNCSGLRTHLFKIQLSARKEDDKSIRTKVEELKIFI